MRTAKMFAIKKEDGTYTDFGRIKWYTEQFNFKKEPIVEVLVEQNENGDYWGFWAYKYFNTEEHMQFVYRYKLLLDMCFPCGAKASEEAGHGELFKVTVKEIENEKA